MADWHAQQLAKIAGVDVVALVDPQPERTARFKKSFFHKAVEFADFDHLLAHPPKKLDAVVLVTPHVNHFPQAKAALEQGLHVLLEKPMVTHSAHAYELWETVKKTGKLLGITFQAPYTANFQHLAAERDAGNWGKVQLVSGWLSQDWLAGTRNSWRQDPEASGGGMMYDSGAHLLNSIMWLMNDSVVEVACMYDRCQSPVDINGVAVARFENGALASIAIGGNCPPFRTEIQIQTDRMLIVTDQYGGKLDLMAHRNKPIPADVPAPANPAAGTPHANFVAAIRGKEPLRVPVRYGVLLSALMDAMYQSADTGKVVKVKPVAKD
jgi:predicted dehydrogenase